MSKSIELVQRIFDFCVCKNYRYTFFSEALGQRDCWGQTPESVICTEDVDQIDCKW